MEARAELHIGNLKYKKNELSMPVGGFFLPVFILNLILRMK